MCWSPDGKRLAYSTVTGWPPPRGEILVMDADGANARSIGKGILPAFSPDGKKILYTAVGEGSDLAPHLAVMDTAGKNSMQLTKTPALMGAWSPDGEKIVYVGLGKQVDEASIWVMDADGKNAKQLTRDEDDMDVAPRWSADGKRIYFNRIPRKGPPSKASIWVMDADGNNEKRLTREEGMDLLGGVGMLAFKRGESPRKP